MHKKIASGPLPIRIDTVWVLSLLICLQLFLSCTNTIRKEEEEEFANENPKERDSLEFEMKKDPALGYVPSKRLLNALDYTRSLKTTASARAVSFPWTERGPIYDLNFGGTHPPNELYSAGRVRALLMDTLNDPTGNTVFCGGISGGLWKCTNFLDAIPNWQPLNEYFASMAVSYICQDPTQPNILYFATGEATVNADASNGFGVWKSTDAGATWTHLLSTIQFERTFRIICDNAGNVYIATSTSRSSPSFSGVFRSKDKGNTWTNITPEVPNFNTRCADLEISSSGRLHAAFGYITNRVHHLYTDDPANVTQGSSSWILSTGIAPGTDANVRTRIELACLNDTLYAVVIGVNSSIDAVYKSTNGGATWGQTGSANTFITGTQGWYDLSVGINPDASNEVVIGGIGIYRSFNSGQTYTSFASGVHVDHHFFQWFRRGAESWVLIGCDGGVYFSRDGGQNFFGKNRNLSIKQFYACSLHPGEGSNYMIAGSQDNGNHKLNNSELTFSTKFTGADGAFSHINQLNPQIQFAATQGNGMNRSTDGGVNWSSTSLPSNHLFINPFTYDDAQNIMYACDLGRSFRRWINAHNTSASTSERINFSDEPGSVSTALLISPFTPNRLFIGAGNQLFRLDNANTVTNLNAPANITQIGSPSFAGYLNCINMGTTENHMVVVFTNYGVNNVWYTNNGGVSWSAVDGNLPDIPVRWATFVPGSNSRIVLGTEVGVYSTDAVNGSSTIWAPHIGVPFVRISMLKVRANDNTIIAATYGRGMYSAIIPSAALPVKLVNFKGQLQVNDIALSWQTVTETNNKGFEIERSSDGNNFKKIAFIAGAGNSAVLRSYNFTDRSVDQPLNYYRIKQTNIDHTSEYSPIILVKNPNANNRVVRVMNFSRAGLLELHFGEASQGSSEIRLIDLSGRTLYRWNGMVTPNSRKSIQVPEAPPVALYIVQLIQRNTKYSTIVERK